MRINQYLARSTGQSRRQADQLLKEGRVKLNGRPASLGEKVLAGDSVELDGNLVNPMSIRTVMVNKPAGYVVSRKQQGDASTVYALLPPHMHALKPVGRLDKDSRGLLLLTNDGHLAQKLTHPKRQKEKVYLIRLDRPLTREELNRLNQGVALNDGISRLRVKPYQDRYLISMHQGRNRQIRRTLTAIGHDITDLLRIKFGDYELGNLGAGEYKEIGPKRNSRPNR